MLIDVAASNYYYSELTSYTVLAYSYWLSFYDTYQYLSNKTVRFTYKGRCGICVLRYYKEELADYR